MQYNVLHEQENTAWCQCGGDWVVKWCRLCMPLQMNSKGATVDLQRQQQHIGAKWQWFPLVCNNNRTFWTLHVSAAGFAPIWPTIPNRVIVYEKQDPRFFSDFSGIWSVYWGKGWCGGGGGEQGCGRDGGRRGLKGRGPGGKEERGFSGLGFGQMAREWRGWPAVSAARTGRNAFLFFALSLSGETQTSAVKQWIKSHIPPIISL